MPWITPTLSELRRLNRDHIAARLPGANANIPNSVLRVLGDGNAGLAHLVHLHLDNIASELLPDTAEDWLDRHADIWLGGRKPAVHASGTVELTGAVGIVVPAGTRMVGAGTGLEYETTEEVTLGPGTTEVDVECITAGALGNRESGEQLTVSSPPTDVDGIATVVSMTGGVDVESNDLLRVRILQRIRNPPMGGAAHDYVRWALEVPGVTRAWCAPLEMGIGTVTVRFMMDELRAGQGGFPNGGDIATVQAHVDLKRPVAVLDCFVAAPVQQQIGLTITGLSTDDSTTRASIVSELQAMLLARSKPGQTIYRSWVDEAISRAVGEDHHELTFTTTPATSGGHLPTLGTVVYA